MSIRPLVILPDSQLRKVSEPVKGIDKSLASLVGDMFETMYDAPGIGLAAIQVGQPLRLVTIDLGKKDEERQPMVFINPEIIWSSEDLSSYEEGCLSIPEYYEEVERPSRIKLRYLNENGVEKTLEAEGLLATCLQHEIDHLDGKLFIDYLSKLKRDRVVKKFTKIAKEKAREAEEDA